MRVLFATSLYQPGWGGKENYLDQLAHGLTAAGHEVRCLARFDRGEDFARGRLEYHWPSNWAPREAGAFRLEPLQLAPGSAFSSRVLKPLALRPQGQAWARRLAGRLYLMPTLSAVRWADVVHYDGIGFELIGFGLQLAAQRCGRPMVVVPHLHLGEWGVGPLDLTLYSQAQGVVAKTVAESDFLIENGLPADNVRVIGNGPVLAEAIPAEEFRTRFGVAGPFVLFLGRRCPEKGFDLLLAAAQILQDRGQAVPIVCAGSGPRSTSGLVQDLGFLSEAEKMAALSACRVLCVPSPVEAFGMVYLEAWSVGRPVISGDSAQVRSVVSDGIDGWTVPPDPERLANVLAEVWDSPAQAERRGQAGLAKVQERYSWQAVVDQTIEFYAELMARRAS